MSTLVGASLVMAGAVVGAFIMAIAAGGNKTSMCDDCYYKHQALSSGKGSYCAQNKGKCQVSPPQKHSWELTKAQKPPRPTYQKNGRRN